MELITPEIQRFSLAIGSLLALFWQQRYGITPGGIIVPGILTNLLLVSPLWCLTVIATAYLIQWIYQRWVERLHHQRRRPMYILGVLSLLISTPLALAAIQLGFIAVSLDGITGSLLPGVIAFNLHRQSWRPVSKGLLVVTIATLLFTLAIVVIGTFLLQLDFNELNQYYRHVSGIQLHAKSIQFLIALLVGLAIYTRTQQRPGGYVVAPMAAALLLEPLSAVMFVVGCLIVELLVRAISAQSLIVGLNRYVVALLLSIAYVWSAEVLFIQLGMNALPFQGNHILVVIAILSYANDVVLYGRRQVLPWMLVMISSAMGALLITHQLWALAT
jgi:hypothetical protein